MYESTSLTAPFSLRFFRQSCHISQEQAASYLQISRQSYGYYERGERPMPPALIQRCAVLFHVSPKALEEGLPVHPPGHREEQDLLNSFRLLSAESRRQILSMIHYEIENPD